MSNENDDGAEGPTAPDAVSNSSTVHSTRRRKTDRSLQAAGKPVTISARNEWLAPDERRSTDVWAVLECPWCGGAHLHRGKAGVRRAPCGRGRYYVGPWST